LDALDPSPGRVVTKTIDLVYFNAGGGHRSAALALDAVIRQQARPWQIRLINLFEVLDPQNLFRKTTGMNPEDIYNGRLARGWTLGLAQELKLLQALIRIGHDALSKILCLHWRKTRPDMVVSLVPNFNRPMFAALSAAVPQSCYVTILTDLADYPPRFWMERNQDQHLICGTARAVSQARAMGYAEKRIHATSGVIIRPDFYADPGADRAAEMKFLKLDPERPTGIVMFGGHGSRIMADIAERLGDTQLIFACGHNVELAARLNAMHTRVPRLVIGFTAQIRQYMRLSDFFIGKPGPGSLSEALQQGLPVIVVRNRATMPQERYNTDWVLENTAGIVLNSFVDVRAGVDELTRRLPEFRAHIARIRNRAVFEIPEILDRLLVDDQSAARLARSRDSLLELG
jgi:UDP-N-acetylglucosamine:LPS N-acetylglucosamine transferase